MLRSLLRRSIDVSITAQGVATLTMSRAPVNAFNKALLQTLRSSLQDVQHEAKAVVLTSNLKCFCGGLDLTTFTQPRSELISFWTEMEETWKSLYLYPLPTVAAINGSSPAWGCVMALSCDHRVMISNPRAIIGLNEAAIGAMCERPLLRIMPEASLPESGDEVEITLSNGQPPVMTKIYAVDSISEPPRARVMRMDTGEEVLVDIVRAAPDVSPQQPVSWVMDEVGKAVVEVREKGPGVLKDGVLDTVDIVKEGATVAFSGAQRCIATLRGDSLSAEPLAPCNPSLEQMYGDQNEQSPTKLPSLATPSKPPVEPTPILLSPREDGAAGKNRVPGQPDVDDWYNETEEVID
ncbi:Eci1 [Symbiodinium pilosum]|uniref:Eci1 protein n=1 Tax=Symbiodinium pilosum TaxID=2952 RepID=A0A812JWK2_SYMPI|nr:Eci1 [Symbiodinium pilosum]